MRLTGFFFLCLVAGSVQPVCGQTEERSLFDILKEKDRQVFDASFETCDLEALARLVADDFEFYHDQSGFTASKEAFLENTRTGLCALPYDARRELVEGSLEVHPLHDDGVLYGAIQQGVHRFFAREEGEPEKETSVARFTHLWLLIDGEWKLSRVLSYDHRSPH